MEEQILNFQEVVSRLNDEVNQVVLSEHWTYTLKQIVNQTDSIVYLNILLNSIRTEGFSYPIELKLVAEHFQSFDDYLNERQRILNRCDGFTDTVNQIKVIAQGSIENPLDDTDIWQSTILPIVEETPIEVIVNVKFSKIHNNETQYFIKSFILNMFLYQSFDFYRNELIKIVAELNKPVVLSTDYYESIITQIIY